MTRSWRLGRFALICWISITILAASSLAAALGSADGISLFTRNDNAVSQCNGDSSLVYCGYGLPTDFCCSKGSFCTPLNNTGSPSAICCPQGGNACRSISTISCDTSLEGPAHPNSPLLISDPKASLPNCGSQCCPPGYECGSKNGVLACIMKNETTQPQSSPYTSRQPASTSSSSPLATAKSSTSSTSTLTPSGTLEPSTIRPTEVPNKISAGAVFAGLFPGIIIGVLSTLGITYLLKRRRNRQGESKEKSSDFFGSSPSRAKISEPIYQPGFSDRSDFMHIRSASKSSIPPGTALGGFYDPTQKRPMTTSTGTLVSPRQQEKNGATTLGAPFETPTRAYRAQPGRVRSLFSKSPSLRLMQKPRAALGRSVASVETIDVSMGPGPSAISAPSEFGMPLDDLPWGERPETPPPVPDYLYSDVYKAAGISPPKSLAARISPPKSVGPGSRAF